MKDAILSIISEFHRRGLPKGLIDREVNNNLLTIPSVAKVIVGPRRSGKTWLLYLIMKKMKRNIKDYVYIDFEDNRLFGFTIDNFEDIIDAYFSLYPNRTPIFFFDEIHNIDGWELFVRRLLNEGYEVYLTGSNSKMLSKEYATTLAGRYVQISVMPLTFSEFLRFKNVKVKNVFSKERFKLLQLFNEFMNYGGFPTLANLAPNQKLAILRSYYESVVFRDIISRYNVENKLVLSLFIKKISENIGNPYSFNSVVRFLHSLNIKTNVKLLSNYYDYLLESFFVINASLKRESFKKREMERKSYLIDNGYLRLFMIKENLGKMFENVVATELYKKNNKLYYIRRSYELDFINSLPIQATVELTANNKDRELEAIYLYAKENNLDKGLVLTLNQFKDLEIKGISIKAIPLWYYSIKGFTFK